jgi:hypothetical protein
MRPAGVTILAILHGICGILGLVGGVMSINFISIVVSLLYLAIAYGLWNGMDWSRILTIIFSALGVVFGIILVVASSILIVLIPMPPQITMMLGGAFTALGIICIVINGLIIYYLTRPHVKAFFGA